MIKVINGNMFDYQCDLLIIPCNNNGELSGAVYRECIRNKIPKNDKYVAVGDVEFIKDINTKQNLKYIGYAVSVNLNNNVPNLDDVKNIAEKVSDFALLNKLCRVSIPLIGAGAGGIDKVESFNILKGVFENIKYKQIEFSIYYLQSDLKEKFEVLLAKPRVFISYTAVNEKNKIWVKKLADRLKENNIDVVVDFYNLVPGRMLAEWMSEEVQKATKVILVFDKEYLSKYDLNKGSGVSWEARIITTEILKRGNNNYKYIPIVVDKNVGDMLPIEMQNICYMTCYDHKNLTKQEFNKLLASICN